MEWLKARLKERTSWDGGVLIAGGIVMILAPVNLIAYGMIAYGAWTMWKEEEQNVWIWKGYRIRQRSSI